MKKGLLGGSLRVAHQEQPRGGPFQCCTLVWISAASGSTSTTMATRHGPSTLTRPPFFIERGSTVRVRQRACAASGVALTGDRLRDDADRRARHLRESGIRHSLVAMRFAAAGSLPPIAGALLQGAIDVGVILNAVRALTD